MAEETTPVPATPGATVVDFATGGQTEMEKTKISKVQMGDRTVMKIVCQPGWKWVECIGPNIPNAPTVCPGHHFGIIQAGTMKMTHEDGTEITVGAGDVYECKPGHTAENIGEDEVVMIEFSQQMAVAYKEVIVDAEVEA